MNKTISVILIFTACCKSFSQIEQTMDKYEVTGIEKPSASSFTSLSIGVGAILYLINPIFQYDNKRLYAGLTKEISVGFGKLGENRLAFEYSFIFAGRISNDFRFSYKYDFLLKNDIQPSHELQGTTVISAGGGYFTDLLKHGVFPEISFGYSIRNHKLLIFPYVKIRYTIMFRKNDSDITDISFGIILGFSNPFIDVDIKTSK